MQRREGRSMKAGDLPVANKAFLKGSLVVLLPVVVGLVAWGWWSGFASVRETRSELRRLMARRAALENANRELRRQLVGLRQDREARVRAVREVLHGVSPGEVVVVVPTPTPPIPR